MITKTVTVGAPPSAVLTASRTETCAGTPVTLDGSRSGATAPSSIVAYAWDLDGDGLTDSSAVTPGAVSWAAAGTYHVTLGVTDSLGCSASTATDVVVNDELVVS